MVYPLPPLRVVDPLPYAWDPLPNAWGPLPYEEKLDGLRTNGGYFCSMTRRMGVYRAAQIRWCGAAFNSPAAVAAPSKMSCVCVSDPKQDHLIIVISLYRTLITAGSNPSQLPASRQAPV